MNSLYVVLYQLRRGAARSKGIVPLTILLWLFSVLHSKGLSQLHSQVLEYLGWYSCLWIVTSWISVRGLKLKKKFLFHHLVGVTLVKWSRFLKVICVYCIWHTEWNAALFVMIMSFNSCQDWFDRRLQSFLTAKQLFHFYVKLWGLINRYYFLFFPKKWHTY